MAADNTVDLIINQKASFRATFTVKNADGTLTDLSTFDVCADYNTAIDAAEDTAEPFTITLDDPANGVFSISLDAGITAALDPSVKYYYDVVVTETGSSFKTRIVQGTMKVSAGVTPINC